MISFFDCQMCVSRSNTVLLLLRIQLMKVVEKVHDQNDHVETCSGDCANREVVARILLGLSSVDLVNIDRAANIKDEQNALNEPNYSIEKYPVVQLLEEVFNSSAAATPAE